MTEATLPFETTVTVRYRDLDAAGHVNNAVYATYVEQARVEYFEDRIGAGLGRGRAALARLELSFEAPVVDADRVTVAVGPTAVGDASVDLRSVVSTAADGDGGGGVVARTESTLVVLEDGDPAPMPGEWRRRLREDL